MKNEEEFQRSMRRGDKTPYIVLGLDGCLSKQVKPKYRRRYLELR
jgi:hypothetical protein